MPCATRGQHRHLVITQLFSAGESVSLGRSPVVGREGDDLNLKQKVSQRWISKDAHLTVTPFSQRTGTENQV